MEIGLTISKQQVMNEVAKSTSYVGAKMEGDAGDYYTHMYTTDEDQVMLERYWNEAANSATDALKEYIGEVSEWDQPQGVAPTRDYVITLRMPSNFDERLKGSIESSLFSYFVTSILSKWFLITNKGEAAGYTEMATGHMEDVVSKLYHRKRPERPNDRPSIGLGLSH
jgi:hypothetical protein